MDFSMDVLLTLERESVDAKAAAINAYKTQMNRIFIFNNIIEDLVRVRGKRVGREYAEWFELIQMIL
jgi:LmbE family N-acetylglucosaminyl deacetylase